MRSALSFLLSVSAATCAFAQPAFAQSEGSSSQSVHTMPVTGNAPEVCVMQPGHISAGGLVNVAGTDGSTLRIQQFLDPQTLSARAASATVAFDAICNFPHTVRIESQNNGMWPTDGRVSSAAQGFAYAVPYVATVQWADQTTSLDANAKVREIAQNSVAVDEPAIGTLNLRIEIAEGASNVENKAPVLAGDYADTLRIFLEPR